jgi:tRNA 2-thiouridine synthesizing protein A
LAPVDFLVTENKKSARRQLYQASHRQQQQKKVNFGMHVLVLGGSTAGASVVAQLRRQSESVRITLIEQTYYLATAYCGLAYAAGGIVRPDPDYLRPLHPDAFASRFNARVLLGHTVLGIDRWQQRVTVREPDGTVAQLPYDRLVYAMGARSWIPPLDGIGVLPGVHALRDTYDLTRILAHIDQTRPQSAVIVGAGFIGLELAESFRHRGMAVTVIEKGSQVMAGKLDADMANLLAPTLATNGVDIRFGETVRDLSEGRCGLTRVSTEAGAREAGIVVFTAGIRPNVELAAEAGLALGDTGALQVDDRMCTNDPHIYALGDVAEIHCRVSGRPIHLPLAGPLAHQAKVLAMNIAGDNARYPGSLGTFICKVFERTVASTGMSEAQVKRAGLPYHRVVLPATNHVYFYPGVESMFIKLLFDHSGGLLGAQVVGGEGADKRIDVLATALAAGMTVQDLEYIELAYAPPYGAPKDAINVLGSLATARIDGDNSLLHPDDLGLPELQDAQLVDIRTAEEFEVTGLSGAKHIPAESLRDRLSELDRDRAVVLYCNSGAKGVSAQRLLASAGFRCFNLMGGLQLVPRAAPTTSAVPDRAVPSEPDRDEQPALPGCDEELDLRGLVCPGPLVGARKHLSGMSSGRTVRILATDVGFRDDFKRVARRMGAEVLAEGLLPGGKGGGQWIAVRAGSAA